MANALLDFVMSLVSDPDAAAHYAADPAQAIADADLTGVTTADVNQLIPVVTESVSSVAPTTGLDAFGADAGSNVWASGAATDAFDAFGDQLPQSVIDDPFGTVNQVITSGDPSSVIDTSGLDSADVPSVLGFDDVQQLDAPVIDDAPVADLVTDHDWAEQVSDQLGHLGYQDAPLSPELDDLI